MTERQAAVSGTLCHGKKKQTRQAPVVPRGRPRPHTLPINPSRHLLPVAAVTGTGVVKFLRCISPMSVSVSFSNQLFYEMNILMELETNFYVANNFYEASQLPRFIRGLSNMTVKTDFSKRKTKLL